MKKTIIFTIIVVIIFIIMVFPKQKGFETKREKLLEQLYTNIKEAELEGKYECCIEPPCTMCYLGNWVWEDGTCDCDDMILKGEYDKVCPQCKSGIKEGKCKSTLSKEGLCEI